MGWAGSAGSTEAAASGRAWLLDEEARCWIGGRERAMGGAEDRLLLRTNSTVEEDGHHPACTLLYLNIDPRDKNVLTELEVEYVFPGVNSIVKIMFETYLGHTGHLEMKTASRKCLV